MSEPKSQIETCKSIFVSWSWGIGIVAGLFIGGASIVWASSAKVSDIDNKLAIQSARIATVEVQVSKIDTVIYLIKNLQSK